MRLFCGIEIPPGIKAGLETLTDRLKPMAKLSWSPIANLHVTTKFIGEWPEERLEEMKRALAGVPRGGPIRIAVRGLGWYPNEKNPRVFWAGIEADDTLHQLAHETEQAVAKLGVAVEDREYHPHLTLARRRNPVPVDRLRGEIQQAGQHEFGGFEAHAFYLYLSRNGSYTKLGEFPLA